MPTIEDLDKRVAKLEKRNPWRFVFQYLLAPLILIVFGFYFNLVLQQTRSEIERIEIAHEIVADAPFWPDPMPSTRAPRPSISFPKA